MVTPMALDSGYWEVGEQIDFSHTMQPIIDLMMTDLRTQMEGTILKAVQEVGVVVDKERLMQALTDAREFFEEGYRAGYADGYREGRMIALGGGYGPMRR